MRRNALTFRDRAGAMGAVALVHVAIALLVVSAGSIRQLTAPEAVAIDTFDVVEPPPPPPPPVVEKVPATRSPREEGSSAPPNLESRATPVVAPEPVVELPPPPTIAAAETPGTGAQSTQGAAPVPGPGTGAGGIGTGTGSGGSGAGTGGGGGLGRGPRLVRGDISRRDYPRELRSSSVPAEVIRMEYTIGTDGRVRDCRVVQSSGTPLLDAHTCRLYEDRYRYEPALDTAGRAVPVTVRATRSWFIRGMARPVSG